MLEAEPRALHNRGQSKALALKHMVLSRCGLNVLVLSRDPLPDCSVYCGSKNQYTVAICFNKWLIGLLPLSVTPKSLNCVILLFLSKLMRVPSGELIYGRIGQEQELLKLTPVSRVSPASLLCQACYKLLCHVSMAQK